MAALRTLGTIIYYFGFLVLILGLFSLAMGISAIFTSITSQVAATQSGAGISASSASSSSPIESLSEPNNLAIVIFGPFVEPFSMLADAYLTNAGFVSPDDENQQMFYPHIRRFYGFLLFGIFLMFLSTLFKVGDQFASFFGGKKDKMPAEFLRIKPNEEKRQRARVMAEE